MFYGLFIFQVNKTNVGISTDTKEVTSDSQKSSSMSSGFPANYGNMRSRNTDSMSPTSTLTSLCEDADSGNSHILSNGLYIIKHGPYNLI